MITKNVLEFHHYLGGDVDKGVVHTRDELTSVGLAAATGLGGGLVGGTGAAGASAFVGGGGSGNISQRQFLISSQLPSSHCLSGHCIYTQF